MEVLEQHGLPLLRLRAGPHSVDLFKHGAHVVSWKVDGEEQLFVSGSALFAPPKPIRGGASRLTARQGACAHPASQACLCAGPSSMTWGP
jgi:hypothetical protein